MKRLLLSTLVVCGFVFGGLSAAGQEGPPRDSLAALDYRKAFDQKAIYRAFQSYLVSLGPKCAENAGVALADVVASEADAVAVPMDGLRHRGCGAVARGGAYAAIPDHHETHDALPVDKEAADKFEAACMKRLQRERNKALLITAREDGVLLLMMIIATVASTSLTGGTESMGGGFSIFALLFNATFMLKPIVRSLYNRMVPPPNVLEDLENAFAKNRCYIPNTLWAAITEKFFVARQNQFQQRDCMEFIRFTLQLTVYKPKIIRLPSATATESIADSLYKKVDEFFNDYDDKADQGYRYYLKRNIERFIQLLLKKSDEVPRYICLHGIGGVGKTEFVKQLRAWMNELLGDCLSFQNIRIGSVSDLTGDGTKPGAMLDVLAGIEAAGKLGAVVFMDEANWLNAFPADAKEVFNGNQSRIATKYFGSGYKGEGISLEMPPLLIFVAMNKEIEDTALRTRFDVVEYPDIKNSKLVSYAMDKVTPDRLLKLADAVPTKVKITEWVNTFEPLDRNFRYIEGNVSKYFSEHKRLDKQKWLAGSRLGAAELAARVGDVPSAEAERHRKQRLSGGVAEHKE